MFSRLTAVFIIIALLLIACAPAQEVTRGELVFTGHCAVCHSLIENQVIVGPSMDGLASRAGGRIDGMDAESYLYASLREPSSYLVEGFRDLMPLNISKELTTQEQDDVIAYLLTLK